MAYDLVEVHTDGALWINGNMKGHITILPKELEHKMIDPSEADARVHDYEPPEDWADVCFDTRHRGIIGVTLKSKDGMTRLVTFDILDYIKADAASDGSAMNEDAYARWNFYDDAMIEYKTRLSGNLPLDKPRVLAPEPEHVPGLWYNRETKFESCPRNVVIDFETLSGDKLDKHVIGVLASKSDHLLDAMVYGSQLHTTAGMPKAETLTMDKLARSFEVSGKVESFWHNFNVCPYQRTMIDYLTADETDHKVRFESADEEGSRYVTQRCEARNQGKTAAMKHSLISMLEEAAGPSVRVLCYGDVHSYEPFGFKIGEEIKLYNGRSVALAQMEVNCKPIMGRDGYREQMFPSRDISTTLTFHYLSAPRGGVLTHNFHINTPNADAFKKAMTTAPQYAGAVTGRWSSAIARGKSWDQMRKALEAPYGGKPLAHADYPSDQRYDLDQAGKYPDEFLNRCTCLAIDGSGQDIQVRTLLNDLAHGISVAVKGAAVRAECWNDRPRRDIDFAAITKAVSGG
jgi:hypothetical protein